MHISFAKYCLYQSAEVSYATIASKPLISEPYSVKSKDSHHMGAPETWSSQHEAVYFMALQSWMLAQNSKCDDRAQGRLSVS